MTMIHVTDQHGATLAIDATDGASMMEALVESDLVLGTCGGMCSCGTCHVLVDATPAPLAAPDSDEQDMLEALADVTAITPTSRLSCQIRITPELVGIAVTIGAQF